MNRPSIGTIVAPMVAALSASMNTKHQDGEERALMEAASNRRTLRGQLAMPAWGGTMRPRGDMRSWWTHASGKSTKGRRGKKFGKRRPGGRR